MSVGSTHAGTGTCYAMFAFEAGFAIDLDRAQRRLASSGRAGLRGDARTGAGADFDPRPLRVTASADPIEAGGFTTRPEAQVTIFDFGAIAIRFELPIAGDHESLVGIERMVTGCVRLREAARAIVQRVAAGIGDAVQRPALADRVEDYVVLHLLPDPGQDGADRLLAPALAARILRGEPGQLSLQEIEEATRCTVSYGPGDLAVIDWNAAIVVDRDPADALEMLEFANVELVEMRHLDDRLDAALEEAFALTSSALRGRRLLAVETGRHVRRIAELQVDATALFESVDNALKLFGDRWLARLHDAATRRLHIDDYERSVLRKIEALASIYGTMRDRQAQLRAEILEWIVITLIAVELVALAVRH